MRLPGLLPTAVLCLIPLPYLNHTGPLDSKQANGNGRPSGHTIHQPPNGVLNPVRRYSICEMAGTTLNGKTGQPEKPADGLPFSYTGFCPPKKRVGN